MQNHLIIFFHAQAFNIIPNSDPYTVLIKIMSLVTDFVPTLYGDM